MKYGIRGKGDVNLIGTDFVTSGGEAQIFRKGKTIYKIYHNPNDMIPDGKIIELQEIKNKRVLVPKDIILDNKGTRVGFTMDDVEKAVPLCKLFANAYLDQNDISNDTLIELVKFMQETIQEIHSTKSKCIQVDGNELNYLADETDYKTCHFIDVNSYQTKSFPAKVIMPSIRDWTAKAFNELTDWYSFAIIVCQLIIGTHPFKGKHPDFKRHDLEARMRANVSIFNPKVQVGKSVRDFSRVPSNYMQWFINLFEEGKREMPPSTVGQVNAKVNYIVVTSTDNFIIEEVGVFDDTILFHSNLNGVSVTRTKKSIYIGTSKTPVSKGVYLVHTPKILTPVLVKLENEKVVIKSLNTKVEVKLGSEMSADELFIVDDTIYIRQGGNLIEMRFLENTWSSMLLTKTIWPISENSSQMFKGVIVQDLLGAKHISIPIPHPTNGRMITIRYSELDGYKVLDAKYDNKVAIFSVFNSKTNEYGLFVLSNIENAKYDSRFINTNDLNQVNFTTLDNGIVILIYDYQMEIFSNQPSSGPSKIKIIKDPELDSSMSLCRRGVSTRFFTDNKLYSIKMK